MNHKIIPYWYDLVVAFAQDFAAEGITWKALYERLFGFGSDINQTMTFALQSLGVNLTDVISLEAIKAKRGNVTYEYHVKEDNGQDFVVIDNTQEQGLINPAEKDGIIRAINRLGYYLDPTTKSQ